MAFADNSAAFMVRAPRLARVMELLDRWLDFFLPPAILTNRDARRCGRMFAASHTFGPFVGFPVLVYLYAIDPHPGLHLWIPMACLIGFWAFLPALRLTGRLTLLALLSVQNLAFIILFVSWHYGGISSPFLHWMIVTTLLTFFYLGEIPLLSWLTLGGLAADLGLFLIVYVVAGPPPVHVPLEQLTSASVVSLFGAGLYATALAAYYAREIASKSELEREIQRHLATARALNEAKDAAEAASRAKTDFLASMSHELRTPLNAVIGFSEIMASEAFGPIGHERYRGYSKDIHDSGSHLLDIINDILDIAKAESGTFDLFEEGFDCREAISDAAMMLRHRISNAGLTLHMDLPGRPLRLRADRRRTKQVFLNLIHNAVKFTPPGGKICISATCDDREGLAITVHDTGIGIARENLKKVLQPFVQVGGSARCAQEGTGLGLPLVQIMMQRHGGRFELDSEPGKSTTARIVFPPSRLLAYEELAEAQAPEPPAWIVERLPDSQHTPVILVVDDDENLRTLIARMLSRGGYRTMTAVHGLDALRCFRTQRVDVVVTDMLMPEMDGTELLRALRVDRPGVPVIAMSGVEEWKEWLRIAEHLGAFATLRKPVSSAQLLQVVHQALSGIRMDAAVA